MNDYIIQVHENLNLVLNFRYEVEKVIHTSHYYLDNDS